MRSGLRVLLATVAFAIPMAFVVAVLLVPDPTSPLAIGIAAVAIGVHVGAVLAVAARSTDGVSRP
jgi:hypothetical protein